MTALMLHWIFLEEFENTFKRSRPTINHPGVFVGVMHTSDVNGDPESRYGNVDVYSAGGRLQPGCYYDENNITQCNITFRYYTPYLVMYLPKCISRNSFGMFIWSSLGPLLQQFGYQIQIQVFFCNTNLVDWDQYKLFFLFSELVNVGMFTGRSRYRRHIYRKKPDYSI